MDSQLSRQLGPPAKWAAKSTGPEIGEGPAAAACLLVLGADFQPAGGGVTPGLAGPAPPHCLPGSGSVLSSWAWKEHPQGGGGGATSLADPTLPAPRGWGQRCEPLSAACPPPLSASPTHCPVFTPQSPAPQGPGRAPGDAAEGVGAAPRHRSSAHPTETPAASEERTPGCCGASLTSTSSDAQAPHVSPCTPGAQGPRGAATRPQS